MQWVVSRIENSSENLKSYWIPFPVSFTVMPYNAVLSETIGVISEGNTCEGMNIVNIGTTGISITSQWNGDSAQGLRIIAMGR